MPAGVGSRCAGRPGSRSPPCRCRPTGRAGWRRTAGCLRCARDSAAASVRSWPAASAGRCAATNCSTSARDHNPGSMQVAQRASCNSARSSATRRAPSSSVWLRPVASSIRAAEPWRRARALIASSVDASLQCRSSSAITSGCSDASRSIASHHSRSMRSRVTPAVRASSSVCSAGSTAAGSCASQLGAARRSSASTGARRSASASRPVASSKGMYGSPAPCSSTHCPRVIVMSPRAATRARKAASSVDLPTPASPKMNTTWRWPASTRSSAASSAASSRVRPIGVSAAAAATGAMRPAGWPTRAPGADSRAGAASR